MMKRKSRTFSRRWTGGFTLVEALAGTAILGTLLAGIIVANARLISQASRARLRIEACEIADGLMERWWDKRDEFPRNEAGSVRGREEWRWRTGIVKNEAAEAMDAEVVALEVFAPGCRGTSPTARVEILLPYKRHEKSNRTDVD